MPAPVARAAAGMEGAGVGKPPGKEPARNWAGQRRTRYGDFSVAGVLRGRPVWAGTLRRAL
jgi:hypothetical protein